MAWLSRGPMNWLISHPPLLSRHKLGRRHTERLRKIWERVIRGWERSQITLPKGSLVLCVDTSTSTVFHTRTIKEAEQDSAFALKSEFTREALPRPSSPTTIRFNRNPCLNMLISSAASTSTADGTLSTLLVACRSLTSSAV